MRRKNLIIATLFFGGVCYLIISGGVKISKLSGGTIHVSGTLSGNVFQELTGKLYISPGGSHDTVLGVLDQAKYTLDIWGYQITDKEIINTLINKAKSGVAVRIILENSMHGNESDDYLSFYKQIKGSGIEVKNDEGLGTNYIHAKTFIIDSQKFIISTANSTYPGFFTNREYWFVGTQKNYALLLTRVFENDRKKQAITAKLPSNLRICPFNCREELTKFIQEASVSIDIQAQYLEDPPLIQLLQQKAKQGVVVRLIFGKYQEDNLPQDLKPLTRLQSNPNVHAKNILIDNKKLYVGSMNLSTNAIEENREIGVVTADKYLIISFLQQFEEDRASRAKTY